MYTQYNSLLNSNNSSDFLYSEHTRTQWPQDVLTYSIFLQGMLDYVWIMRPTPFTYHHVMVYKVLWCNMQPIKPATLGKPPFLFDYVHWVLLRALHNWEWHITALRQHYYMYINNLNTQHSHWSCLFIQTSICFNTIKSWLQLNLFQKVFIAWKSVA